jgi:hypothetical protein
MALPGCLVDSGSPGEPVGDESVGTLEEATSTGIQYWYDWNRIYYDGSVPGIRMAVTVCKTTTARRTQVVECPAHSGYALIAGGFKTLPQNGEVTPLVTESYQASPYLGC